MRRPSIIGATLHSNSRLDPSRSQCFSQKTECLDRIPLSNIYSLSRRPHWHDPRHPYGSLCHVVVYLLWTTSKRHAASTHIYERTLNPRMQLASRLEFTGKTLIWINQASMTNFQSRLNPKRPTPRVGSGNSRLWSLFLYLSSAHSLSFSSFHFGYRLLDQKFEER